MPAPHRQIVLTIPKMLRIYFRYDRRLLGDLCRVAAGVIVESFRVLLAVPHAQPGLVVCVHTYGERRNTTRISISWLPTALFRRMASFTHCQR